MNRLKRTTTAVSLLAELSHIFCCGLPVFFAVMSAGSQIGIGGAFLAFHSLMHDYERMILIGSGVFLALGLGLHFLSFLIDHRANVGNVGNTEPFRMGWILALALVLYAANIAFYFVSGHGYEPPRFN